MRRPTRRPKHDPVHPHTHQPRTLWRLDPGHATHALYIVSDDYVNAAVIQEQFGAELSDIATCSYDPFLGQLATGQQWRFAPARHPRQTHPDHQTGRADRVADPTGVALRVPHPHQPA